MMESTLMERPVRSGPIEVGDLRKDLLNDFAALPPQDPVEPQAENLQVFLRIRPLTSAERSSGEDQDCVSVDGSDTVILKAPRLNKSLPQTGQRFTFTQVFGPDASQRSVFDGSVRDLVRNVLDGGNCLVFTYGVTNAGKTFTFLGPDHDSGLLPRALALFFQSLEGRLYSGTDLKPLRCRDFSRLTAEQQHVESASKRTLLKLFKESDRSISSGKSALLDGSNLSDSDGDSLLLNMGSGVKFSVWVSFCEIYNDHIHDLLQHVPLGQQKRTVLRLSQDVKGNSFIKDLRWVQVGSSDEAYKLMKIGRKNQSMSATRLNQLSSRSHSIFSVRLMKIDDAGVPRVLGISELSLCDLAGSERCSRTQNTGDRLKEAGNINNSLLTLGKCISAMRANQYNKVQQHVPFRESKLTHFLQFFFCGSGSARVTMVVNINQSSSSFDETLNVLKFSALAQKVVVLSARPPPLVAAPPTSAMEVSLIIDEAETRRLRGRKSSLLAWETSLEDVQETEDGDMEDGEDTEDIEDSDEEGEDQDDTELEETVLEVPTENVAHGPQANPERLVLEAQVREEVSAEFMELFNKMEKDYSERLEKERELLEERAEKRVEILRKLIHRTIDHTAQVPGHGAALKNILRVEGQQLNTDELEKLSQSCKCQRKEEKEQKRPSACSQEESAPCAKRVLLEVEPSRRQEEPEEERQKAEEERQRAEEERQRAEEEWQRAEGERQKAEGERQRAEEEWQKAEGERQRAEEERQRAEEEWQRAEEERQRAEGERQRAEEEKRMAEGERRKAVEERQVAVEERQRAVEERQRAEEERQRAEEERQRAEEERQRADEERQRAEEELARPLEVEVRLNQTILKLQQELEELRENRSEMETRILQLSEEACPHCDSLLESLEAEQKDTSRLNRENKALVNGIFQLQNEVTELKLRLNSETDRYNNQSEEMNATEARLQSQSDERSLTISDFKQQVQELDHNAKGGVFQKAIDRLTEDSEAVLKKSAEKSQTIQNLEEKLLQSEELCSELRQRTSNHEASLERVEVELKNQLSNQAVSFEHLEAELKQQLLLLKQSLETTENEKQRVKQQNEELLKTLTLQENMVHEAHSQVDVLKTELERLKNHLQDPGGKENLHQEHEVLLLQGALHESDLHQQKVNVVEELKEELRRHQQRRLQRQKPEEPGPDDDLLKEENIPEEEEENIPKENLLKQRRTEAVKREVLRFRELQNQNNIQRAEGSPEKVSASWRMRTPRTIGRKRKSSELQSLSSSESKRNRGRANLKKASAMDKPLTKLEEIIQKSPSITSSTAKGPIDCVVDRNKTSRKIRRGRRKLYNDCLMADSPQNQAGLGTLGDEESNHQTIKRQLRSKTRK